MLCLDPVQSSYLVRVQFESVSGHPAMHSLSRVAAVVMSSSWQQCKYNCIVIGKRVKSDTMSVDNVRKVNHIQHEQYWAKD